MLRGPLARDIAAPRRARAADARRSARLAGRPPRRAARQRHRLHAHRVRRAGRRRAPRGRRAHGARLHRPHRRRRARGRRGGAAATTRSRRWSRPARSAWASTSPTSASSCTSAPRRRRSRTTSRSAAPAAPSTAPTSCCCRAPRTGTIWRYFATASMPRPEQAAAVLARARPSRAADVDGRAGDGDRRPAHPARAAAQGARRRRRGRARAGRLARHRPALDLRRRALRPGRGRPRRRGRAMLAYQRDRRAAGCASCAEALDDPAPRTAGGATAAPGPGTRRPCPTRRGRRRRRGCARSASRSRPARSGPPAWTAWTSRSRAGSPPGEQVATGRALGPAHRPRLGRPAPRAAGGPTRPDAPADDALLAACVQVLVGWGWDRRPAAVAPSRAGAGRSSSRASARSWPGSGGSAGSARSPSAATARAGARRQQRVPAGRAWDAFAVGRSGGRGDRRARRPRAARRRPRRLPLDAHRRRPGPAARRAPAACSPSPSRSRPDGRRSMLLAEVAAASEAVARDLRPRREDRAARRLPARGRPGRGARRRRLARRASPGSAGPGVGWASLRDLPPPGRQAEPLTVLEVDAAFDAVAGRRRRRARAGAPATLLLPGCSPARPRPSSGFLRGLLAGELRQGAQEGVMLEAVGARRRRARRPTCAARVMLRGDLRRGGRRRADRGRRRARGVPARVGRPLAADARPDAPDRRRRARAARARPRSSGSSTAPASRCTGTATTSRCSPAPSTTSPRACPRSSRRPLRLPAHARRARRRGHRARADGRPRPFQVTVSRVAARRDVERPARAVPLTPFVFDLLHLDGDDLLDRPGAERRGRARAVVPAGAAGPAARRQPTPDAARGVRRRRARPRATRASW